MPEDVQYNAIKEIKGFENVKFFRPGYAIEYDYFPPTQLSLSLETKLVENLFFAGQLTLPGPGVPPSLISGQVAARQALKYLGGSCS